MAEENNPDSPGNITPELPADSSSVFKDLNMGDVSEENPQSIDFILDIPVQLTVELGRTKMPIKNLVRLTQGSVVPLNTNVAEPLDVYVNGTLVAKAEIVVIQDKFGIRLTDIISPAERMRRLSRQ
ncbi:MAG: flagellar motor switch protein FliN [Pseudomonadota bacterium]|jgi:flagellar motor switch protein FliN/FliY|uniref:Flagellar motor switch protein FliN n=1 Tax=Polynucleobacter cosmopolitanus TaxID=351345 RepID=A0A229FVG5_9BURK|nr:flagellar motor switch protein FliN [Polynucleobacter cosmopolitanus]OXL15558.1 flagellar motor switch protein FliN [Polynucleobacter cosmopolitanus]